MKLFIKFKLSFKQLVVFGIVFLFSTAGFAEPVNAAKIHSDLMEKLTKDGKAEFFVVMMEQADLTPAENLMTKEEKGQYVFDTLTRTADKSQAGVKSWLSARGCGFTPFWISNKILVTGDLALVNALAERKDVREVILNHTFQAIDPKENNDAYDAPAGRAVEWNVQQIRADDVWSTWGVDGAGIVVMGADTGVDWDHPALINQYRGWSGSSYDHNYNWFDATGSYPTEPTDGHSHGTHTVGTMVGDDGGANQIGVAPGAEWIGFKNMTDGGSGDDATFTKGFEWAVAPTDLNDLNPMPSMAPHIINNSWGYSGGSAPQFEDEVAACRAAGIFVVVASGNEGSGCGTLRSPGDYQNVFTSGATESGGQIWSSSSRGPSALYDTIAKPEVVAPGANIRSSTPGGNYTGGWSGTSMAAPHVAGSVALLWSANPGLIGDIGLTEDLIEDTAGSTVSVSCPPMIEIPNNVYGWGEIDCYAIVGSQYGTPVPTRPPTATPTATPTPTQMPTVPPCAILLVDDDNNAPDVRSYYTNTLDSLGYYYNVFDTDAGSDDGPSSPWMALHDAVIWFSGDIYGSTSAGPNSTDEAALAAYLDGGGRLFLSSQDYLYDMTLTSFGTAYLGISSYTSDSGSATQKYGVSGDPVGNGLGPYTLTYPSGFSDYGDIVNPTGSASTAFTAASGGSGNALDTDLDDGTFKTVFFGTSFVPVAEFSSANGDQLMQAIIDFLDICGEPTPTAVPTVTPTPGCVNHGDVNFDGSHTADDAQLAFSIVIGVYTPTFLEECAADCNGNAVITAEDAQMIFAAIFGGSCVDPI